MNPQLSVPLLALLLIGMASPGYGMISVADVTPKNAQVLGIELVTKPVGKEGVFIELKFSTAGTLKGYSPGKHSRISLSMHEGKATIMSTTLRETYPGPDLVETGLFVERSLLEKMELMIVIGGGLREGIGYRIKLSDFIGAKDFRPIAPEAK